MHSSADFFRRTFHQRLAEHHRRAGRRFYFGGVFSMAARSASEHDWTFPRRFLSAWWSRDSSLKALLGSGPVSLARRSPGRRRRVLATPKAFASRELLNVGFNNASTLHFATASLTRTADQARRKVGSVKSACG